MSLRVASYNIRKCVGLDWKRNPERVISVINQTEADIIAIQEIDKRFGSRESTLSLEKIENNTDYKLISLPLKKQSSGFHGNALLIRKHMLVQNIQALKLYSLEPRGALAADIQIESSKKQTIQIRIIGVHLAILGYWRKQQIQDVFKIFVNKSPSPINIIAGDFNEMRENRGFYDKVIAAPFQMIRPGPSFHSAKPYATLDKFVVIGKNYEVKESGVLKSDLARKASDHLPVWIDLNLSE